MRATYIRHFKESKAYIIGTRKEHPEAYICFQGLAEKWDKEKSDVSSDT